jgi:hypothetical protein
LYDLEGEKKVLSAKKRRWTQLTSPYGAVIKLSAGVMEISPEKAEKKSAKSKKLLESQ